MFQLAELTRRRESQWCQDPVKVLELPMVLSLNRTYRVKQAKNGAKFVGKSREAINWKANALKELMAQRAPRLGGVPLKIQVRAFCDPTKQAMDVGNMEKLLMDTMEEFGVYDNDNQIEDLRLIRMEENYPGGKILIYIWEKRNG